MQHACTHAYSTALLDGQGMLRYASLLAAGRTSDSLMAGTRSCPLSFLLLGSKSACLHGPHSKYFQGHQHEEFVDQGLSWQAAFGLARH
jgi:hypothetical protein